RTWNGVIDEVEMFNRALSQSEIQSLFNAGTAGKLPAPTVAINQAAAQADPTSTSPINFTATFSEPVAGFATGDVTLSGTAGATTATVTGSGALYNVAVSGMTGAGTVIVSIPAAKASGNISGLPNSASTSIDNVVSVGSLAAADLTVTKTHSGNVTPGQTGV